MAQVNVDTVIQAYVKLRDMRSELKQKYDAKNVELKAKMERLEVYLLETMNTTNASQLGSEHGTAYKQTSMRANCSDWPTFWAFQQESGRFDMTEKRVASKAIQTYYEENGELPPGINMAQEVKVIIRRS